MSEPKNTKVDRGDDSGHGKLEWTASDFNSEMERPLAALRSGLAKMLYHHLERLDPSYESVEWDSLTLAEKEVYRLAIESTIIQSKKEVLEFLSDY